MRTAFTATESEVLERIGEKAWLDLACELVPAGQPEAENPLDPDEPSGREEGIALLLAEKLEALGFSIELKAKTAGRPNVIATLAGAGDGPTLILNDHLDTYPAGDWTAWTMTGGHPFRPTRHGDKLYARGTSDTRGNLACTLLAAEAIIRAGIRLKGTLKCVYTVDEEKNGPDGSIFLLDDCRSPRGHGKPTDRFRPPSHQTGDLALSRSRHATMPSIGGFRWDVPRRSKKCPGVDAGFIAEQQTADRCGRGRQDQAPVSGTSEPEPSSRPASIG